MDQTRGIAVPKLPVSSVISPPKCDFVKWFPHNEFILDELKK
jgi:hypothetical protein